MYEFKKCLKSRKFLHVCLFTFTVGHVVGFPRLKTPCKTVQSNVHANYITLYIKKNVCAIYIIHI